MSKTAEWFQVGKRKGNPNCHVCGKDDWCTFSPELKLILCMRVESGRPSRNSMGGWLHPMNGDLIPAQPLKSKSRQKSLPPPNFQKIWFSWRQETSQEQLRIFAQSLGVSPFSLEALNCVWTGDSWAIPMKDARGMMIGMRIRTPDGGAKFAVRGSGTGLFMPFVGLFPVPSTIYIMEGPTDTAAALTMSLYGIGRPTCSACVDMIKEFISLHRQIRKVVIISDNDERRCPRCKRPEPNEEIKKCPADGNALIHPGLTGARKLQSEIKVKSSIWIPPCKDLRQYLNQGGSKEGIK